jgi:hypothetical protein
MKIKAGNTILMIALIWHDQCDLKQFWNNVAMAACTRKLGP